MIDWLKIDKVTIFKGKDENGNRYLSQFLSDYKKVFKPTDINAGCQRCLVDYYNNFTKHLMMGKETKEKEYVLKAKYNGIPLEFGSAVLVTNQNITKEYAEKLLKNHPRGKELFEKLPEDSKTETKSDDLLKGLKRPALDEIAKNLDLIPADYKNVKALKKAIQEKQEEVNYTDVKTDEEE